MRSPAGLAALTCCRPVAVRPTAGRELAHYGDSRYSADAGALQIIGISSRDPDPRCPPVPDSRSRAKKDARIIGYYLKTDAPLPKIHDVVRNVSDADLSYVEIEGTFYVDDRAAEITNVSEREMKPSEARELLIWYFRGDDGGLIDGYEVEDSEIYL